MHFGRSREDALAWIESTDEPNTVRIAQTRPFADWVLANFRVSPGPVVRAAPCAPVTGHTDVVATGHR